MARSVVDRARRACGRGGSSIALTVLAVLGCAFTASAAAPQIAGEILIDEGYNYRVFPDGSTSVQDVKLSHGRGGRLTRITAGHALAIDKPAGVVELTLSGKVHVEFRQAVLDADSAVVLFRGEELVSVQVTGSQAQFSHQLRPSARRVYGRADTVAYTAANNQVRFSGRTSWTDGLRDFNADDAVIYNITDGTAYVPGRGTATVRVEEDADRVPPPRTPDPSTAQ